MRRLGSGIVGCGNIAGPYAQTLQTYPEIELAGATDLDTPRAEAFAAKHGCRAYPSLEAMQEGRPHRATGEQAAHIVEILAAPATSIREGRSVEVRSKFAQPAPLEGVAKIDGATPFLTFAFVKNHPLALLWTASRCARVMFPLDEVGSITRSKDRTQAP